MSFRTAVGIAFVLVAFLANPWFLESFVVLDGAIAGKSRVVVAEVVLAIFGIALIVSGRRGGASQMPARIRLFAGIAAGFALLMSLAFAEVFLRLIVGPGIVLEGEKWSQYKWRARHTKTEAGAQEGPYDYDRFDPLLGWLPKRNYKSDAIQTNSMGIRSKREYAFQRTPGTRRIVFVGDSYTWGERTWKREITNDETFVSLVEERLPGPLPSPEDVRCESSLGGLPNHYHVARAA